MRVSVFPLLVAGLLAMNLPARANPGAAPPATESATTSVAAPVAATPAIPQPAAESPAPAQSPATANPAGQPDPATPAATTTLPPEPSATPATPGNPAAVTAASEPVPAEAEIPQQQVLPLLNSSVTPGTFRTLHWMPGQYISSLDTPVPVLVAHGKDPGPTLCLTAAIHGDEINGIEIVRRMMHQIDPDALKGTVIGVPIVNLDGFRRATRYLSDRRDLNRFFPGNPTGSYASRMAHSLFQQVILKCDYLVDIHTASFYRTNLPQLRGDLQNKPVLEFSRHFGGMSVLHNSGATGTLRRAANDAGIPSLTMEAGGPHALEQEAIAFGVKGLKNVMHNLNMMQIMRLWRIPQPVFYQSIWVRTKLGGIMLSKVDLDEKVREGQLLGRVIDPITNTSSDIVSPINGIILGKALDQVVSPGFATFHIGVVATEEQLEAPIPAIAPDLAPPTPAGAPAGSPATDPDTVDEFPDTES